MSSEQKLHMMTELRQIIHEIDPSFVVGEQAITKWVVVTPKDGFKVTKQDLSKEKSEDLQKEDRLYNKIQHY